MQISTYDAAKILGLNGEITPKLVKIAYKEAALKYHPDRNPAGAEMMQAVNAAYQVLKDFTGKLEFERGHGYGDELATALNAVINLSGLVVEVCGSWVWISGNSKEHKETLKEAGFKWAPKKKMWHFRPASDMTRRRTTEFSMDQIREKHGSKIVRGFSNRQAIANA